MFQTPASARIIALPSLLFSLLFHVVVIASLFLMRIPATQTISVSSRQRVTLMAPAPESWGREPLKAPGAHASVPEPVPPELVVAKSALPKPALRAPAPSATVKTEIVNPIETPHAAILAPELPSRIAPLSPLLRTGTFEEAQTEVRIAPPPSGIRSAGFADAGTAGPVKPRGAKAASREVSSVFNSAAPDPRPPTPAELLPRTSPLPRSFGDSTVAAPVPDALYLSADTSITPVEILEKPRPVYTEEARRLAIEGEVSLEVVFEASGRIRVERMVRGLGHGLDETAMAAARLIRFRPARRLGESVDSPAVVRIVFQLAY